MPTTDHETPESRWADLDGPVHWVDHGGAPDGPLLVLVHGLGGSHVNWTFLAPLLTPTCRVVALDLAGFGHTPGAGRPTTVEGNARLLHRFCTEVLHGPVVLVGNSMGGLAAAAVARDHPSDVAGLVLVDLAVPPRVTVRPPSLPVDPLVVAMFVGYSVPGLSKLVLRGRREALTVERIARDTIAFCFGDPAKATPDLLAVHVQLARTRRYYRGMDAEFTAATRSVLGAVLRGRSFRAWMSSLLVPVLMFHGEQDRLVRVGSARALARRLPRWRYEEAAGVGHVPHLEAPEWCARHLLAWLEEVERGDVRRRARLGVVPAPDRSVDTLRD